MNAIDLTRAWVGGFVVDLNLCPFARVPFEAERIRYRLCDATTPDTAYRALLQEIARFAQLSAQEWETGLFIVPHGLEDFGDYLDVLEDAQAALQESALDEMLQLASFHPDYVFEGVADDDPANYTNRSPLPMFHLIRQDGLAAALENYPDPESIPLRNEALLREMGLERIHALLKKNGIEFSPGSPRKAIQET